jgi:hypothetical protein
MQLEAKTIDAPPPTAAAAWVGWYRRRGRRYVRVAEGDSYDDCWGALLDALDAAGRKGGDSVVLPAGQDANRTA